MQASAGGVCARSFEVPTGIASGKSLACSYLRHVKRCWLVQTNWKTPERWGEGQQDADRFSDLKQRFDRDGAVFKKTKDAAQFLKQGEIDVVGVDREGNVHAMEVAFHEAGLNYGHTAEETYNRVLKKMLRMIFILNRSILIHPPQTALHAYFLSPKVNPAIEPPLVARDRRRIRRWHRTMGQGIWKMPVGKSEKSKLKAIEAGATCARAFER